MLEKLLDYDEYKKIPLEKRIKYLFKKNIYTKLEYKYSFTGEPTKLDLFSFETYVFCKEYYYKISPEILKKWVGGIIIHFELLAKYKLKTLKLKINLIKDKKKQKKYLKEIYFDINFEFIMENKYKNYENWYGRLYGEQELANDLFLQLFDINRIFTSEILHEWSRTFVAKTILDYCNNEIESLTSLEVESQINTKRELTSNQSLILIDKIRNISVDVWDNLDIIKKAKLISKANGFGFENIRKNIPNIDKSEEHLSKQFIKDILSIEKIIDDTLG